MSAARLGAVLAFAFVAMLVAWLAALVYGDRAVIEQLDREVRALEAERACEEASE